MEKRGILAVGLMLALLVIYQTFFLPQAPPPPSEKPAASPPSTPAPVRSPAPEPPAAAAAEPVRLLQTIATVVAPLYRGSVSSEGAKLQEWTLQYRGEKPLVILGELGPTGWIVALRGAPAGPPLAMSIRPESLTLETATLAGELALSGSTAGLRVTGKLTLRADSYA